MVLYSGFTVWKVFMGEIMPKKVYNLNASIFTEEDKYFIIHTPSEEVAERIVKLWNGGTNE